MQVRVFRNVVWTAVWLAAVLALAAPARAGQSETDRVDRTVAFGPGGVLILKNFSGEVRITGADRSDAVIHAVRRAPRERLDRIKLDIQTSGSRLTIDANKRVDGSWWERHSNNVVETDFEIEIPARTDLEVKVFSSDVRVSGVQGRQEVHGFSGTLTLLDVTGAVDAKTFSGDIEVAPAGTTEPDLVLETFSGDILARLQDGTSGRVRVSSFSGDIQSDLPLTLHSKSRRNLDAQLGSGGGRDLRFKTFSGDVTIRK
jgi:DUF4097 and DUF4098 domain-containing protein YvlB